MTGSGNANGTSAAGGGSGSEVAVLRAELERTRAEKDTLDEHYRSLLEKVGAMRTTLGNKLKLDAVCLLPTSFHLLWLRLWCGVQMWMHE